MILRLPPDACLLYACALVAGTGIDFQAEGLLDGLEGEQRAERLALLRHLESEGVPLAEIQRRSAAGTLILGTADRVLGGPPHLTAEEVSALSGVDVEPAERRPPGDGAPAAAARARRPSPTEMSRRRA